MVKIPSGHETITIVSKHIAGSTSQWNIAFHQDRRHHIVRLRDIQKRLDEHKQNGDVYKTKNDP